MAEYEGNVLRAPGMGPVTTNPDVDELLASTVGYTQKGGTVKANTGLLEVGQMVKYNTSTHCWEKATAADVQGFVRNAVNVQGNDMLIDVVVKGIIKTDVRGLKGADLNAIATTLGGRVIVGFGPETVISF